MNAALEWNTGRRAVLVDRHPLWLDAVERLLAELGFSVAAKLTSAEEAIASIEETPPELLVTDLETEDGPMTGLQVLEALRRAAPAASAIVISAVSDPDVVQSAFRAGAAAYVLKSASAEDVAAAARQTFRQSIFTSVPAPAARPVPEQERSLLTPREQEVLALVARGEPNRSIGTALRITEQTVKLHLSNAYRKLGVANRTQASRRAAQLGLLTPHPSDEVEPHLLTGMGQQNSGLGES